MAAWRRYAPRPLRAGAARAQIVATASRAGHRTWRPLVTLGAEFEPDGQGVASLELPGPRVAIGAHGQAVVVWPGRAGGRTVTTAASRGASGPWRRPGAVTVRPGLYPDVATDVAGDAVAVWEGRGGSVVTASRAARGRHWSTPRVLDRGNPDVAPCPEVAAGAGGEASAVWSGDAVRAAVRPYANAGWHGPVALGPGGLPQITIAPAGQAIAAWQRPLSKPRGIVIEAAGALRR